MTREEFEQLVEEEFPNAIPDTFRSQVKNVAFLIEDEPSMQTRREEGLHQNETLLGLYHGIPATARGDSYGMGATLPDTITLFQRPIEKEATETKRTVLFEPGLKDGPFCFENAVRQVIRETMWHEVAHHFGFDEHQVRAKEAKRDSI